VLAGEVVHQTAFRLEIEGIVSYWDAVSTPLVEDGIVAGIVHVTTDATDRVQAYQMLERRVAERTHEMETLLAVQQAVTSRLNVEEVLQLIADEARRLTAARLGVVYLLKGDDLSLAVLSGDHRGAIAIGYQVPVAQSVAGLALCTGHPYCITDAQHDARVYQDMAVRLGAQTFMVVPLVSGGQSLGVIMVVDKATVPFSADDERLLTMLASSAATALENARLYEQAKQTAAATERERLARDLHDSVTQTLFSASLIAEALPQLWEHDQAAARQRLNELRDLTTGALAEMRTLLLELRPAALTKTKLPELLRQLAAATTARGRVPVTLAIDGQRALPPDVHLAFYRIAQEALNNVAKHAGAQTAAVHLRFGPRHVALSIRDDGRGFTPRTVPPQTLGLSIMRERAAAINARLQIKSRPGCGTTISLGWPTRKTRRAT
jgi:signal transduction histidine kinase